ncbi:hypothetical protein L208DRAFT_1381509 [Tricholoma matsutake]|nr:hypothetical protein L208DRAFT_1381509 [Tricholoma matsutake 945]
MPHVAAKKTVKDSLPPVEQILKSKTHKHRVKPSESSSDGGKKLTFGSAVTDHDYTQMSEQEPGQVSEKKELSSSPHFSPKAPVPDKNARNALGGTSKSAQPAVEQPSSKASTKERNHKRPKSVPQELSVLSISSGSELEMVSTPSKSSAKPMKPFVVKAWKQEAIPEYIDDEDPDGQTKKLWRRGWSVEFLPPGPVSHECSDFSSEDDKVKLEDEKAKGRSKHKGKR